MPAPRTNRHFPRLRSLHIVLGVLALGVPATLDAAGPGDWTPDKDWREGGNQSRYAVHLALLPGDGNPHHSRILWYGSEHHSEFHGGQWGWRPGAEGCASYPDASSIVDLGEVVPSGMNPFCGAATLIENRLLSVGGTSPVISDFGEKQTRIFTPGAGIAYGSWSDPGSMASWRWYPTTVHLRDQGRIMAVAGIQHRNHKMFGLVKDGSNQSSPDADLMRRQQPVPFGTWDDPVYPFLQSASRPAARIGHSMVEMTSVPRFFADVMFGGRNASGAPLNDVWRLETRKNHPADVPALMWCPETPSAPFGAPVGRSDHVMIRTPNLARPVVIFGGLGTGDVPRNDVWRLLQHPDTASKLMWRPMEISGTPPAARFGHSAIYDATLDSAGVLLERMIVFGGAESASSDPTDLRVYELRFDPSDPNAATWHEMVVVPIGSSPPAPRLWHSLTADSAQRATTNPTINGAHVALLFGGKRTSTLCSDSLWGLWIMKNRRVGWQLRATTAGGGPAARARHSAVFDPKQNDRLYVYGGENASGPADSYLYVISTWDPDNSNWQQWTDMGFTLSGHTATLDPGGQNVRYPEIYNDNATGNRWFRDTSAPLEQSSYPFVFMVPGATNGKSRVINLHKDTLLTYSLDVPPTESVANTWQKLTNASLPFSPAGAVQYRPGKLMMAGGSLAGSYNKTGLTYTLDTSDLSYSWVASDSMTARWHHNLVLLPTGQVLAVGGNDHPTSATEDSTPRPQLWTPNGSGGGTWTSYADAPDTLAEQPTARTYHSTAVLLPDGRVLSAGGETPIDKYVANIYCPPYLYDSGGNTITHRPQIQGAPSAITWGTAFTVCVDSTADIQSACLMRPGATTHSVDMNQSFIPLTILAKKSSPARLHLTTPTASDAAAPGYYMLFVLGTSQGAEVPSIARWVQVNSSTTPAPDELIISADLITCDAIGPIRWAAPGDNGCASRALDYDLRYSFSPITSGNFLSATPLPSIPDPATGGTSQTAGTLSNLDPNTLVYFAGRTRSSAGNWSALAYTELGTLGSCGGGGYGTSSGRARDEVSGGDRVVENTQGISGTPSPADGALRRTLQPRAEANTLEGTSALRLVAEFSAGEANRWRLHYLDLAGDETRLTASARGMVFDEPASGGWELRDSIRVAGGLAGVRSLPAAGRLIFPAGTILEALESGSRSFTVESADHSELGEIPLGDSTTTEASLAPGDTLDLAFRPASSPGEGEDCVFLVRVPGSSGSSMARRPGQRPGPGSPADEPGLADPIPTSFALHPARPNPFSGETSLRIDLPSATHVRIELFDIQGRRVARLLDHAMVAGRHTVNWNGRGDTRGRVGAGVYLCRMTAGSFAVERRITLLP